MWCVLIDVYGSACDIVTNNDDKEVTFVDFQLTDEKETTKCNENVKENVKKHSQCSFETMKILKLERHVQRIHGVVLVKDVLPLCGYCLCLESGQKYHNKNRDLQSHLIRSQITNYISKLKSLIYFKVNN